MTVPDSVYTPLPGAEQWASTDNVYRWRLSFTWPSVLGHTARVTFCMLNPSTGTPWRHDATMTRCFGYAIRAEANRMSIVNLSPYRATKPSAAAREIVREVPPPWWDHNFMMIRAACREADTVILAWGAWGAAPAFKPFADAVRGWLAAEGIGWYALGFTARGEPVHPLRQPRAAPLVRRPLPLAAL